jgi:hypothetical protein
MRDEKKALMDLIAELKRFLTLNLEEKKKEALVLNDWGFDCRDYSKFKDWQKKANNIPQEDNSKISLETEDIFSSLTVLHHYADDPEGHDEMIKSILEDAEEHLKVLEKDKRISLSKRKDLEEE